MVTTATHDTKRGEDVRARINVLTELPAEWGRRLRRWSALNRRAKSEVDGAPVPSPDDEYLLYQTLVGAWPIELLGPDEPAALPLERFRERINAYMIKAVREAKQSSNWATPNTEYEAALSEFRAQASRLGPFLHIPGRSSGFRNTHCIAGDDQLAGSSSAQAHHPWHPGHLSGMRILGSQPRRSRQPAPGRFQATFCGPRYDAKAARCDAGCSRSDAPRTGMMGISNSTPLQSCLRSVIAAPCYLTTAFTLH